MSQTALLKSKKGYWVGLVLVTAVVASGCAPIRASVKRQSLKNAAQNQTVTDENIAGEGGPAEVFAATAAPSASPSPNPSTTPIASVIQVRWESVSAPPQELDGTEPSDDGFITRALTATEIAQFKLSGKMILPVDEVGLKLLEVKFVMNQSQEQIDATDPAITSWVILNRVLQLTESSDVTQSMNSLQNLESATFLFRRQEILVGGNESL